MTLSDLTSYASEVYHISERYPWTDFPGFSVLSDPGSGKWIALLMRKWDSDLGEITECCDIKCGQEVLRWFSVDFLSLPFRMKGRNWVGVKMGDETDTDIVSRLLDRALQKDNSWRFTISLDDSYEDVSEKTYQETSLKQASPIGNSPDPEIPEKILQMRRLYEYGPNSMEQKGKNFYRQGKFMEDYADDQPWNGYFRHYFPTYHDLNVPQLRGYFTWRTGVRRGEYRPTSESFAYIYLYELLNGIGTSSPEDALQKMKQFETNYLDAGYADLRMRQNLHQWMRDFCVLNQVPAETAWNYVDDYMMASDRSLNVLKNSGDYSDEAVFFALCHWRGSLTNSSVIKKQSEKGQHLFAEIWRRNDLFSEFFGKQRAFEWYPLSNAVRYFEHPFQDADYNLDECRSYHCRNGSWEEWRYEKLYSSKDLIQEFLRTADRVLRDHLRTGHYLKARNDETWAEPLVREAITAAEQEEAQREREKRIQSVSIDFSHLDHIREDAAVTRDSLLTEEQLEQQDSGDKLPDARETDLLVQTPLPENSTEKVPTSASENTLVEIPGLDTVHAQILQRIAAGQPVEELIKTNHLMSSLVTDTINEALFDEIGDNILECGNNTISLIEDYRDEVEQILNPEQ